MATVLSSFSISGLSRGAASETTRAGAKCNARRLLAAGGVALSLLGACGERKGTPSPAPRVHFEIALVDDAFDPFVAQQATPLPPAIAILEEPNIARWPDTSKHHYARLVLQAKETLSQAKARVEPWIRSLALPQGERLVWQPVERMQGHELNTEAYRTYLVNGLAVVGTGDLESVTLLDTADRQPGVGLKFSKAASERLRQVTHDHVKDRMAILIGDTANSAPQITTEIANGMLQVSMGTSSDERARAEAKALARALGGR